MPDSTITLVLAPDRGAGLDPLTMHRPKAAVPFGGKYRVIDFTLANCLHSGLRQVLVLTQYKSHSLHKHLRDGWFIFNPELGEFITAVPLQQREGLHWYGGPFDAIRQNRYLLERSPASQVLVLEGAAVYRMDYAELIRAHRESGARVTLALRGLADPGGGLQTRARVDGEGRVTALGSAAAGAEDEGGVDLTTMGVQCFDKAWLLAALEGSEGPEVQDQDLVV
jgi:glucose-1-phosphate adenylyltransferase